MQQLNQRKAYFPKVSKYLLDCEVNYHQLLKLIPDLQNMGQGELCINEQSCLRWEVLQRCKYTTMIDLYWHTNHLQAFSGEVCLPVRLYHDMQTAEVVKQGVKPILSGKYAYPNKHLQHPDEKLCLNEFLKECLSFTLKHGYSKSSVSIS